MFIFVKYFKIIFICVILWYFKLILWVNRKGKILLFRKKSSVREFLEGIEDGGVLGI